MTIAEIRGKISKTGQDLSERMEDLLTSDVFSACRYVRPKILLIPFLQRARDIDGQTLGSFLNEEVKGTQYLFWPRLRLSEPDVVIAIQFVSGRFFVVLIEAKYFSSKTTSALTGEDLEVAKAPTDQLAKEYMDLLAAHKAFHIPESKVVGRALVYATAHRSLPRDCMAESLADIARSNPAAKAIRLFWVNWFELHPLISQTRDASELERLVLSDLGLLIERKRLVHFRGFRLAKTETFLAGTLYSRPVEERPSHYRFTLAREALWTAPMFYLSHRNPRRYHFDVHKVELHRAIYKEEHHE